MPLALAMALTSALGSGTATARATGASGAPGLYRLETAEAPPAGELVLALSSELFTASSFLVAGDTDRFVAGHLVVSWSPLELVTVWGSWSMAANSNDQLSPRSTGWWGDPTLGAKLRIAVASALDAGVVLSLMVPTSAGGSGLAPTAAVLEARAVASYAVARGVVVAANAGYVVDRTSRLFDRDVASQERFVAGVYGADSISLGAGAQAMIDLTPAVVAGGFAELTANVATASGAGPSPVRATFGVKALAPASQLAELVLGTDVRLAGAPREGALAAGIPPWQVFLRLAGHWGAPLPSPGGCESGVCIAETVEPPTFRVRGKVVDQTSGAPIPQAHVTVSGLEGAAVALDPRTAAFAVGPIPADGGLVQIKAEAKGYKPARATLAKGPPDSLKEITLELVPAAVSVGAVLKGIVIDAATGKPVRALVSIPAVGKKVRAEEDGSFRVELEAGRYELGISDPAYVSQAKTVELRPGDVVILNLDLTPRH